MADLKFNCPHCAQHLSAPIEAAGRAVRCPACQEEIQIPATPPSIPEAPAPPVSSTPAPAVSAPSATSPPAVCAICLSPLEAQDTLKDCPECQAHYHAECWDENGGCAVYGCGQAPAVEGRQAIEIPISYWGQENKACPSCGTVILAAARRCRQCGATFASARPEDSAAFAERSSVQQRAPRLRRTVVWLFILCVLPCLSPIGTLITAIWYASHKKEVALLPSLYPALAKLGLGVGIGQTVAMILMTMLFAGLRGS